MNRLSRWLVVAVLGIALMPTAARAQFFGYGFPFGGYGFGGYGYGFSGYPFGGYGYGGWPYGLGWGGYPMGGWGGNVTGPSYYWTTSYMTPIVYTVSTPSSGYFRDVPVEPQLRPAVWPAIPYRDTPRSDARARLDVRVPAESAEVWLDGVPMREQSGIDRHYITPRLAPGTYRFDIRVSWRDTAGKEVTRTQQVEVQPGEMQTVSFIGAP